MKTAFISIATICFFVAGCSVFKNTTQDGKMQIVNAGYTKWSKPPVQNSTVPEKGVNLALIIKNWPEDASLQHIIFEKHKSFTPQITDSTDMGIVVNARIIKSSSVRMEISKETELSDRLVYQAADGETRFVEIEQWTRIPNEEKIKKDSLYHPGSETSTLR